MESARKVINQFLKGKFEDKDLKSELFKAAEAAIIATQSGRKLGSIERTVQTTCTS